MMVIRLLWGLVVLVGIACEVSDQFENSNFLSHPRMAFLLSAIEQVFDSVVLGNAMELAKISPTDTTHYSKTGSIMMSTSRGPSNGVVGLTVNECASTLEYSFKVFLAADTCSGGTVHFYSDFTCSKFLGKSSIEAVLNIIEGSKALGGEAGINCTTSASSLTSVPFSPNSVIALYHSDIDCTGKVMEYSTQPTSTCFPRDVEFASYTCDKGYPQLSTFTTNDCSGTPTSISLLTTHCLPVDDLYDFADAPPRLPGTQDATFVADWAKSVHVLCSGGL